MKPGDEPPQLRLDAAIDRQGAELAVIGREALRMAASELPTANRFVDEHGGLLRVHFTPGMALADTVLTVSFHAYWISYDFPQGNRMMDVDELLRKSPSGTYHYVIEGQGDVTDIEVRLLLRDARERAEPPLNPENRGRLFVVDRRG